MKALITALLVSVSSNSYSAQAPYKTSDEQAIARGNGVSVRVDAAGDPVVQVFVGSSLRYLDPKFVAPNKPFSPADVKVRLFRSDGSEINVSAEDPKISFLSGMTESYFMTESYLRWMVVFKIVGADIAAVDSAEVQTAGGQCPQQQCKQSYKLHEVVPRDAPQN